MLNIIYISLMSLLPMQHPIHVAMINIDYNTSDNTYNIIIKVFTDDFEKNIYNLYKVKLNSEKENENNDYNNVVSKYINKYFKIRFDNKLYKLNFMSKKSNFEATWLKFKLSGVSKVVNKAEIINNIMNQFYRDQTNLLIFTKEDLQKAFNMNYTDTIVKFSLN